MQPYHLLPRTGPSMADEWLEIALNHHLAGKYPEAEQAYLKGLRVDPNHGPIVANLGVMAAQQNNMTAALQRLERSLLFDDGNATVWYNYALALLECERSDDALAAIDKSIEVGEAAAAGKIEAHHASAYCARGMILTSLGRAGDAVEAYAKALACDQKHPTASYNAIFVTTLINTEPAAAAAGKALRACRCSRAPVPAARSS